MVVCHKVGTGMNGLAVEHIIWDCLFIALGSITPRDS